MTLVQASTSMTLVQSFTPWYRAPYFQTPLHYGEEWKCSLLSHVWLFAIPWTVAHQAPLSMGFSRPKYWSELPFLSPGDLPLPGKELGSPALQADSLLSEPPRKHMVKQSPNIPSFQLQHEFQQRRTWAHILWCHQQYVHHRYPTSGGTVRSTMSGLCHECLFSATLFKTGSMQVLHNTFKCLSFLHVCSVVTPWTAALQAPLPMDFSSQEYRSRLPFPLPEDLPYLGIEPGSPASLHW